MNVAFLCNTGHVFKWFEYLPKNGDHKTIFSMYGTPETNLNTILKLEEFKPDVIHLHWREHRDPIEVFKFIRNLKKIINVPLMMQLDYQPRYLVDQDREFAELGDLLVSENILVDDFPKQPGVHIKTCYIGADEWGADNHILFYNGGWIDFKDVYDVLAGKPTLFTAGSNMKLNRETKKNEDHLLKISKAEDRQKLWATCWHDRPEMPMDDKFTMMKALGPDYKCRWFNGWEANVLSQMHAYAGGQHVPESHYEAYEHMQLDYWEKLSECICAVDNMYWGTCSLGLEAAALKIPLTANSLCTTAVVMNPKLVTDDIKEQTEIVRWLLDNPDDAKRLGEEAYNNCLEHYTLENKMKRYKKALEMVTTK